MKTTIAWKVTLNKKSWCHRAIERDCLPVPVLYYNLNEKTIPGVGKILCFKNPRDIYEFLREAKFFDDSVPNVFTSENLFIFRGIAENPAMIKKVAKYSSSIDYFWRRKKKKKNLFGCTTGPAPKGTVSCTSFYPTEQYSWSQFLSINLRNLYRRNNRRKIEIMSNPKEKLNQYPDGTDLLWMAHYRKDPNVGLMDGCAAKISYANPPYGVSLIIPGWSTTKPVWCPACAIPPVIFQNMKKGNRYHVGCNIGAEKREELCFDEWEDE